MRIGKTIEVQSVVDMPSIVVVDENIEEALPESSLRTV